VPWPNLCSTYWAISRIVPGPRVAKRISSCADALPGSTLEDMTIQRLDNVGIVVDHLAAAIAFFVELGLELDGEATLEGRWVDRVVGLDDVLADIAMVRTPDGHGRIYEIPRAGSG
jgi:hypothetical protein